MKNNFSCENNQQRDFQVNYNYYPQQPHDPYDYEQQIVTPTSALDCRLTIHQLNDLYPRSSILEYKKQSYHESFKLHMLKKVKKIKNMRPKDENFKNCNTPIPFK